MPEGFRKVAEKTPVYRYEVPSCTRQYAKTSQVVSAELVDEILFKAIGVHFLEPLVHFEQKFKVKPAITKTKKPPADALGYMKKVEKKIDDKKN